MDRDSKLIMEALKMKNPAPQIGIQHGLDRIMEELVDLIEAVKPLKSVSINKNVLGDISELQRGLKLLEGLLTERMYAGEGSVSDREHDEKHDMSSLNLPEIGSREDRRSLGGEYEEDPNPIYNKVSATITKK